MLSRIHACTVADFFFAGMRRTGFITLELFAESCCGGILFRDGRVIFFAKSLRGDLWFVSIDFEAKRLSYF